MRKAIGIGCVILGVVCLSVSVGFVLFNHLHLLTRAHREKQLKTECHLYAQRRPQRRGAAFLRGGERRKVCARAGRPLWRPKNQEKEASIKWKKRNRARLPRS